MKKIALRPKLTTMPEKSMKERVVDIVDLFAALPLEEKAAAIQLMRTKAKENWEIDAKATEAQMCRLKELNELFFRS